MPHLGTLGWIGLVLALACMAVLLAMLRMISSTSHYAGRCKSREECDRKHADLLALQRGLSHPEEIKPEDYEQDCA